MGMTEGIRNSAKAVIRRGDNVLMIRAHDELDGDFYYLPGGGQNPQETMAEAVRRECLEETGCAVTVGELLYVCEYIHERLTYPWQHALHQIDFMFRCELTPGGEPGIGATPDDYQTGVVWVPLLQLPALRHYPKGLAEALRNGSAPIYWGRGQ